MQCLSVLLFSSVAHSSSLQKQGCCHVKRLPKGARHLGSTGNMIEFILVSSTKTFVNSKICNLSFKKKYLLNIYIVFDFELEILIARPPCPVYFSSRYLFSLLRVIAVTGSFPCSCDSWFTAYLQLPIMWIYLGCITVCRARIKQTLLI